MRVFLSGGIGNQLFQVSAARYFTHFQGDKLTIDGTWTKISRHPSNTELSRYLKLLPREKFALPRPFPLAAMELRFSEKIALNNWAIGKGFAPYRHSNSVLDMLHPSEIRALSGSFLEHDAHKLLLEVNKSVSLALPKTEKLGLPDRYAAIHVRGGDYFALGNTFGILNVEFYREALKHVAQEIPLVWLTNDFDHASRIMKHFNDRPNKILTSESLDTFTSLAVFGGAEIVIAANSSFSWWGAEISSAVRLKICPSQYSPNSVGNWMIHGDWVAAPSAWI